MPLFVHLKNQHQILSTGTIRSTRIGLPGPVKNPGKMIRGEYKIFQNANDLSLTACVWQDTCQVRYISTAYSPNVAGAALRRISSKYEHISQPLIRLEYCRHYQNIDRFDQATSTYLIGRKSFQSWKYLWFFCFQAMIINSFILYKKNTPLTSTNNQPS